MHRLLAFLCPLALVAQQPAVVRPALPRDTVNVLLTPTSGRTIRVVAGDNAALQAALDTALGGDAIVLPDRSTFVGSFTLTPHSGSVVTLRSETLSPVGVRVSPTSAATFATLVAPNAEGALTTQENAHDWRIIGLTFRITPASRENYGIIILGSGAETTRTAQPTNIVLDRVYIDGGDRSTSRCVSLNGVQQAVIHSYLSNCHAKGRDAQAIAGWSGAGPFLIDDNYLEGSGQAIMFGGSDAKVSGLTPSDITIRNNDLFKPLAWAGVWTVKATFELKHAQRVLFQRNRLENHWIDAQVGFAVLLQTANQDCGNPWAVVGDVTITENTIRNSTQGINLLSRVNNSCAVGAPMRRILIQNNVFEQVGTDPISGAATGRFTQLLSDLEDVSVLQNTFQGDGAQSAVVLDYAPQHRTVLWNNLFDRTEYGIIGSGFGVGNPALAQFAPDAVVRGNVLTHQQERLYPAGNFFPATIGDAPTINDGARIGADVSAIPPIVVPPTPLTCDGHPSGFVIRSGSALALYAGERTEQTLVMRGGRCLGVTTLGSSTRYAAHVRTLTGWRTIAGTFTSRLGAELALVTAGGK
jgi:hypothetical protein